MDLFEESTDNVETISRSMNDMLFDLDIYGRIDRQETRTKILYRFFDIRSKTLLNTDQWEQLKSIFFEHAELCVGKELLGLFSVIEVLTLKSSLVFLSRDFSEIAETMLYSALMEQLDREIDSWPSRAPHFANYESILKCRDIYRTSLRLSAESHYWWLKANNIRFVNGEKYKKAKENYETAMKYQRIILASTNQKELALQEERRSFWAKNFNTTVPFIPNNGPSIAIIRDLKHFNDFF